MSPLPTSAQPFKAKVAIIIDDIGYQKADPDLIRLPFALTLAVMPFAPNSAAMLQLARQHHKEIMLHMPMEAVALNHLLGKGALRQQMPKAEVQQKVREALQVVPGVLGVNNHMGSLYTTLQPQMDWVMEVVADQGLYFIDSKTSGQSVVSQSARKHQVQHRSRDVFLDNDKSYAALDRQFQQLIQLAHRHGSAIAIGHPYPETYKYLKKNLPKLAAAGIELVPASQLLQLPAPVERQVQSSTDPLIAMPAKLEVSPARSAGLPEQQPESIPDNSSAAIAPTISTQPSGSETAAEPAVSIQALGSEAVVEAIALPELPDWRVPLQANPAWYKLPEQPAVMSPRPVHARITESRAGVNPP